VLALLAVVAVAGAGLAAASTVFADPTPLWQAHFPDGRQLITNEIAYSDPGRDGAHVSPDWIVTSGSLFADGGAGSSGRIDGETPDVDSRRATGSAVMRAVTTRDTFRDVEVRLELLVDGLTSTDRTPRRDYDGVHLMVRYASPDELYTVDLCRRDGTATIKKKVPRTGGGGGGRYVTMAESRLDCTVGGWRPFVVRVENQGAGVRLTLSSDGREVVSALDGGAGEHPPLRAAGRIGIRGDNAGFSFRDLAVYGRDP
jgi:hypothetical protein